MKNRSGAAYPWRFLTGIKSLILLVIIGFGLFLHLYTQRIISGMRQETRGLVSFYAQMYARLAETESNSDLSFLFDEIVMKTHFPLIYTDDAKKPVWWREIGVHPDDRSEPALARVQKLVERLDDEIEPVPIKYEEVILGYLYFSDSNLIQQLHWMPYIEIGIISIFIAVGFIGFANLKRSEQRFIWVGMAKETAHQLGTPLSSLLGWLEILRDSAHTARNPNTIYAEMSRDLARLQQVTSRFSKIGSRPDLKSMRIEPVIYEVAEYIKVRVPQLGRKVSLTVETKPVREVLLNPGLFQWALENILKNSLDAMNKPDGRIHLSLFSNREGNGVIIEIEDNGRGIDHKDRKKIFKPGFSSKKRGWGLGLSLARRIVEEYHNGRIFLKSSRIGLGSIIRIELDE